MQESSNSPKCFFEFHIYDHYTLFLGYVQRKWPEKGKKWPETVGKNEEISPKIESNSKIKKLISDRNR